MSYARTPDTLKKLSDSIRKSWISRFEANRKMAVKLASREFAETQLRSFDDLPQDKRIDRFTRFIKIMMEDQRRRKTVTKDIS